jgi:hypothetical protein
MISVDIDATRGWSEHEVFWRIAIDHCESFHSSIQRHPAKTKAIVHALVYMVGDWMAQVQWGKKNVLDFNLLRTLRNGAVGVICGPIFKRIFFGDQCFDSILPTVAHTQQLWRVGLEQGLTMSSKTACYLGLLGAMQGDSLKNIANDVLVKTVPILQYGILFWTLADTIMYMCVPELHRILWIEGCQVIWYSILAYIASCEAANQPKK